MSEGRGSGVRGQTLDWRMLFARSLALYGRAKRERFGRRSFIAPTFPLASDPWHLTSSLRTTLIVAAIASRCRTAHAQNR